VDRTRHPIKRQAAGVARVRRQNKIACFFVGLVRNGCFIGCFAAAR
jgi:hypothetical protein